ncbi:MAG: ATP synthase F1 subunit epsilon [Rubrobacter sp.]|nr:ATP synthase F1 subunit epsilon [Rubrobacter sp.]
MASGRQLFCRVITPERTIFDGEADRVITRIEDGEIGVLADHIPLVSTVEIGDVRILQEDETSVFATSDGFFKVSENLVLILVEEASPAEEIDVDEAQNHLEEVVEGEPVEDGEDEEAAERVRAERDRRRRIAENLVRVARKYGEG